VSIRRQPFVSYHAVGPSILCKRECMATRISCCLNLSTPGGSGSALHSSSTKNHLLAMAREIQVVAE